MLYVFKDSKNSGWNNDVGFFSCNGSSQKPTSWEKIISVALDAASTLLERSKAKVGYICDGEWVPNFSLRVITSLDIKLFVFECQKHFHILSCLYHLLLARSFVQMQLKLLLPFLLIGYKCIGEASTEMALSRINYFSHTITSSLKRLGKYLITLIRDREC